MFSPKRRSLPPIHIYLNIFSSSSKIYCSLCQVVGDHFTISCERWFYIWGCLVSGRGSPCRRFGRATCVLRKKWPPHATPRHRAKRQVKEENESCGSHRLHSNQAVAKLWKFLLWRAVAWTKHPLYTTRPQANNFFLKKRPQAKAVG